MSLSTIDGDTRVYGIIGNPVRHSLSPIMHNAAFSHLELNNVFLTFPVEQVKDGIQGMRALDIQGLSITMPHKTTVIPFLDWVDPIAMQMNTVNTIVNEKGVLKGYNTDGLGAYRSITDIGLDLNNQSAVILGNGGTAKAIAFTLLDQVTLKHLYILGRSADKVQGLVDHLKEATGIDRITSFVNSDDPDFIKAVKDSEILINTTPIGMSPDVEGIALSPELILEGHTVFDVVYKPTQTRLLKEAESRGARCINGIEMLVNQGVIQFELWTQKKAPRELMFEVIRKGLA